MIILEFQFRSVYFITLDYRPNTTPPQKKKYSQIMPKDYFNLHHNLKRIRTTTTIKLIVTQILLSFVCALVQVLMESKRDHRIPWGYSSCELPKLMLGMGTWVLCKSIQHFEPLSQLSSPRPRFLTSLEMLKTVKSIDQDSHMVTPCWCEKKPTPGLLHLFRLFLYHLSYFKYASLPFWSFQTLA